MTNINLTLLKKVMTLTSVKLTSIFMFYIMLIMYMYFYNEPIEAEIINKDIDNQVQEESKFEIKEEIVNTTMEPIENGAEAENNNSEINQDIVPIQIIEQPVEISTSIEKTEEERYKEDCIIVFKMLGIFYTCGLLFHYSIKIFL